MKKKKKKKKEGEGELEGPSSQGSVVSAGARSPAAVLESEPERESSSSFASIRSWRLRQHLRETRAEDRLTMCVQKLLSAEEIPWNPYPTLARLLRREEMLMEISLSDGPVSPVSLWRESQPHSVHHSALDFHLARLPEVGAAWRPLTPMLDCESLKTIVGCLSASRMLEGSMRPADPESPLFAVRSVCTLAGDHVFAGKQLVRFPRTIELREIVQAFSYSSCHFVILALAEGFAPSSYLGVGLRSLPHARISHWRRFEVLPRSWMAHSMCLRCISV